MVLFEELPHVTKKTSAAQPRSVKSVGNVISLDNDRGKALIREATQPIAIRIR